MTADFMEGVRYIKSDKTILALIAMALISPLLLQPYMSLMPIFAKDIMKGGAGGLGLLMGAVGFGSIIGALLAATVYRERHKGFLLLGNTIAVGVFLGFFAFTPWFAIALPLLAITGAAQTSYNVLTNTLIQTITPRHLRGRTMGTYSLHNSMMPLGTFLAGGTAGMIGAPMTVGIMAASGVLVPLWIAFSVPRIRHLQ